MKINGLELIKKNSKVEFFKNMEPAEIEKKLSDNFPEKSFALVFLDHRVLVGIWENMCFQIYENQPVEYEHIQRIRVFNKDKEFHAWRTNKKLKGRLRQDYEGNDFDIIVANQVLFGTDFKETNNGFTEIYEDRGTRLFLPFNYLKVDEKRNRIFIKTYNYVAYNAACQATYTDCRFVSFTDTKKDLN